MIGLWDFADGTAKDRSPSRRDGQFHGNATVLSRRLPTPEELERPTVLVLIAVDERDSALPGAQFDVLEAGQTVASVTVEDVAHTKQLVLYPNGRPYDVWARRAALESTLRDLEVAPGEMREVRMVLKPSGTIGGNLRTFDGSPHVATVVQAVDRDGKVRGTTVTDRLGNYRIEDLPLGDYHVRCHVLGGFRYFAGPDQAAVQAGSNGVSQPTGNARRVSVSPGRTERADFQCAPFKKGTWRTYTSLDGLAANFVICLEQAYDGALWLGTGGGVSRFDGVHFTTFKEEDGLCANQMFDILAKPDGAVWFATAHGLSRGRWGNSGFSFERLPLPQGWTIEGHGWRPELAPADGQGVWVVGGNGLWRTEGTSVHPFATIPGLWYPSQGPDGSLWLGTASSTVWRLQGTNLTRVDLSPYFGTNGVNRVVGARDGSLWCQTASPEELWPTVPGALDFGEKGGLAQLMPSPDGSFTRRRFTRKEGLLSDDVLTVATQADAVWCTYRTVPGATRLEGDTMVHFTEADGLPNAVVNDLLMDRDGTIWFASGAGAARWDPNTFAHFTRQDGLPGDRVWVSHPATNGVLVCAGERSGGWGLLRPGPEPRFELLEAGRGNIQETYNVAPDGQGGLWLPLWSGGVGHFDGQAVRHMPESKGWPTGDVCCVAASPGGELWVAHATGLSRHLPTPRPLEGDRFDHFPQAVLGLLEPAQALGCDTEGRVWVGFDGGGVVRFDGRAFQPPSTNEGVLAGVDVFRIIPERDGSVWFATEAGVTRYAHGRFDSFNARHPALRDKRPRTIFRDGSQVLWFGTDAGAVRFDGLVWSTLDSRDGLAGNEVCWISEDADGRIWLGADKGLTRYERTRRTPPPHTAVGRRNRPGPAYGRYSHSGRDGRALDVPAADNGSGHATRDPTLCCTCVGGKSRCGRGPPERGMGTSRRPRIHLASAGARTAYSRLSLRGPRSELLRTGVGPLRGRAAVVP